MKLSEKLAALEEEEKVAAESVTPAAPSSTITKRRTTGGPARARGGDAWEATKRKVRELVLDEVAPKMRGLSGEELSDEVKSALDRILQREDVSVSPLERRKFVQEMISDTPGYGPLDVLLQDITITEIMCNAYDDIWVERSGLIERTDMSFTDDSQYRQVIDKIVSNVGRRVDEGSPMVDARLPDGSRVNAIIPPLAVHGRQHHGVGLGYAEADNLGQPVRELRDRVGIEIGRLKTDVGVVGAQGGDPLGIHQGTSTILTPPGSGHRQRSGDNAIPGKNRRA
jgi:hypothetical protein